MTTLARRIRNAVQDPAVLRRFHAIAVLWANIAGHWSAWQATRIEEGQESS